MNRVVTGLYKVTFDNGFTHYLHSSWGGYAWEVAQRLFPDSPVRSVESVDSHIETHETQAPGNLKDATIASTGTV